MHGHRVIRLGFGVVVSLLWLAGLSASLEARVVAFVGGRGPASPGMVNLPYTVPDNSGNSWMVYHGGWLQQQGNQPLYSQGAMLNINGRQPSMNTNQARLDEKTEELVIENLNANGVSVTRRIYFNRDEGYVRYIDVLKNPQKQDATVNVSLQSNLNWGIQASQNISDPRKKSQDIAWVGQTGAGRSVLEVYAGKNAKTVPAINWPANNNAGGMQMQLTIPAGKEQAVMHLHLIVATMEAGAKFVNDLKEAKLLQAIPAELRKIIVNFSAGQNFIGDCEILRGDLFDVVELRSGDQLKGTIQETVYKLSTFYGTLDLPVSQVVGLLNVGDFRPRQLLVLADGQIFGGRLQSDVLRLQLSSGQVTQIPLSQISRMGYRKRPNEPEEWTFDKPLVLMRSGDRVGVQMPAAAIPVNTRYGLMQLQPQTIAAIYFQCEEHGVHEIYLTDGSRFAGLVGVDRFDMKLADAPNQAVAFPLGAIGRMQLAGKPADTDDSAPNLALANEDVLVGVLQGQIKLDTAFDTLTLNGPEIKRLVHPKDSALDVQVTLWDDSVVSGQLQQPDLDCLLGCGLQVKVPAALVTEYNQPLPQPSPGVIEKIKAIVADLNAEDWKQRDQAEAQLISLGQAVVGVIKQMHRPSPQRRSSGSIRC